MRLYEIWYKKSAVEDVRNGMSYCKTAQKYKVNPKTVRLWCNICGVYSPNVKRR